MELAERCIARVLAAARWLALPLALLLFLQWPLRDVVQSGSRQANDLAQCLFSVYVALSVTEATRRGSHLAPRPLAPAWAARWQRPVSYTHLQPLSGSLFGLRLPGKLGVPDALFED